MNPIRETALGWRRRISRSATRYRPRNTSHRSGRVGSRHTGSGSSWSDVQARKDWYEQRRIDPVRSKENTSPQPWGVFQRQVAGDREVDLGEGDKGIWADGLHLDPDWVVAVEAKFVASPGRSMYEGQVPPALVDRLLRDFDDEMQRYGEVIKSSDNPVGRLRLVASTPGAADFLGARARRILGPTIDLDVRYIPLEGQP